MNEVFLESLLNQTEHEGLDFKKGLYVKQSYEELLKDVLAMANAKIKGSRYIVFGVKENALQIKEIFELSNPVDAATYQEIVLENIEPQLICNLTYISYQEKRLAILEITEPKEQPYLMKKKYGSLHKGFCYVRKGSKNEHATRADFDYFFKQGQFEIHILDKYLAAVDSESGHASLECSFRNCTEFPISIRSAFLEVWDNKQVRTIHRLYGFDKNHIGADFRLSIPAMTEITDYFAFGFTSNDCLILEMNEYGYTNLPLNFKLYVYDTLDNEYYVEVENCRVMAKGKFLWKINSKNNYF
ncbi:ATP-binding protein [Lysinibacillus sp. OL1_EC]|uniref:AlbA family DNA-binding domain-containing protein n=1 Tax=unclassified Lysinibacillus TaxID=2636778 RepID=UPI00187D681A|nr:MULTISPECIES: ATP-binding protein [unclassified Lysinibacillus]MCM0624040.1 ATP-binding protein [Lysinibacillus sp. OL1_EC]UKJ43500.1 ATP-binding protein [Lysinibacillus sp. ACHW1.5]